MWFALCLSASWWQRDTSPTTLLRVFALLQDGSNTTQYHALPCNAILVLHNTTQYHATLSNTIQYHTITCITNGTIQLLHFFKMTAGLPEGTNCPLLWLLGGGEKRKNLMEVTLLRDWNHSLGCNLKPNCLLGSHCEVPAPPLNCIRAFLSTTLLTCIIPYYISYYAAHLGTVSYTHLTLPTIYSV